MRNRRKIQASVRNAAIFLAISAEFGSFYDYLCQFTQGRIFYETGKATSPLSDAISTDPAKAWHEICRQYHHLCVFTGGLASCIPTMQAAICTGILKMQKSIQYPFPEILYAFSIFPKIIRQCHESQTPSADTGFSLPGKRLRSPPKGLAHAVPRSVPSLPAAAVQTPD